MESPWVGILRTIGEFWYVYVPLILLLFGTIVWVVLYYKPLIVSKFIVINFRLKQENDRLQNELKDLTEAHDKLRYESDVIIEEKDLKGRYFAGIQVGRSITRYCLIDYDRFQDKKLATSARITRGSEVTNRAYPGQILRQLCGIIGRLNNEARSEGSRIDGIGVGLPGQVEPIPGRIVQLPGISVVPFMDFTTNFINSLRTSCPDVFERGEPAVQLDNDVRCATRYLLVKEKLRERRKDAICIFVGNNTGSTIIQRGKIMYGHYFAAGEIGHTTVCWEENDYLLRHGTPCDCRINKHHWEMYASSSGMMRIAKCLDPGQYNRYVTDYNTLIASPAYSDLLRQPFFAGFGGDHFARDPSGNPIYDELTTYFMSLAFYAGDPYAMRVVREFFKLLAIGIANYIHIVNPETVYLGGGMIDAFFTERHIIQDRPAPVDTVKFLSDQVRNNVLIAAKRFDLRKLGRDGAYADVGAALIFKDPTYFQYIRG